MSAPTGPTVCWACYDPTTLMIAAFVWSNMAPSLASQPNLTSRRIDGGPPPFNAAGYAFDASWNVTPLA
jgi:hypothetical protein